LSLFPAPTVDPDADFFYDYENLRIGGLIFAGVIVILSVLLLTGNRIKRCGKRKLHLNPVTSTFPLKL
uniref:FXYD domain-containing ion transport regulator n=1 Tax=Cyprinus carpio TaxID=7962 RepID=A0A8C2CNB6_CYPCA